MTGNVLEDKTAPMIAQELSQHQAVTGMQMEPHCHHGTETAVSKSEHPVVVVLTLLFQQSEDVIPEAAGQTVHHAGEGKEVSLIVA